MQKLYKQMEAKTPISPKMEKKETLVNSSPTSSPLNAPLSNQPRVDPTD